MLKNLITKKTFLAVPPLLMLFTLDTQAAAYRKGDFSIKPLNVSLANFTIGRGNSDSKIDNGEFDIYKESEINFGANSSNRNGWAYGFEAGYFVTDATEIFGTVDFIYENGNRFSPSATRTFDVDSRLTPGFTVGARRYFPKTDKKWIPFVGVSAGLTNQDNVEADLILNGDESGAGNFSLQGGQTLLEGELQFGIDYRFDQRWALSFKTGVHYSERGDSETNVILGQSHTYTDNREEFTVPFVMSLKIVL